MSTTYMDQYTMASLIQIMACLLFSAKPSPEPMQAYYQLDLQEQVSVKPKLKHFDWRKMYKKCRLQNCAHFVLASNVLIVICRPI